MLNFDELLPGDPINRSLWQMWQGILQRSNHFNLPVSSQMFSYVSCQNILFLLCSGIILLPSAGNLYDDMMAWNQHKGFHCIVWLNKIKLLPFQCRFNCVRYVRVNFYLLHSNQFQYIFFLKYFINKLFKQIPHWASIHYQ